MRLNLRLSVTSLWHCHSAGVTTWSVCFKRQACRTARLGLEIAALGYGLYGSGSHSSQQGESGRMEQLPMVPVGTLSRACMHMVMYSLYEPSPAVLKQLTQLIQRLPCLLLCPAESKVTLLTSVIFAPAWQCIVCPIQQPYDHIMPHSAALIMRLAPTATDLTSHHTDLNPGGVVPAPSLV